MLLLYPGRKTWEELWRRSVTHVTQSAAWKPSTINYRNSTTTAYYLAGNQLLSSMENSYASSRFLTSTSDKKAAIYITTAGPDNKRPLPNTRPSGSHHPQSLTSHYALPFGKEVPTACIDTEYRSRANSGAKIYMHKSIQMVINGRSKTGTEWKKVLAKGEKPANPA